MNPLFYDALSGDFHPPTDPDGKAHTLARLSVATVAKGDHEKDGEEDFYYYRPSWAYDIGASVVCNQIGAGNFRLSAVLVGHHVEDEFSLALFDTKGGLGSIVNAENQNYPLGLGDELNNARAFVTASAQQLFDSIA